VKIIIEEGDAGGLAPGVYKVGTKSAYVSVDMQTSMPEAPSKLTIYQPPRTTLELELEVDMNQKPKPVPTGRYVGERLHRKGPIHVMVGQQLTWKGERVEVSKIWHRAHDDRDVVTMRRGVKEQPMNVVGYLELVEHAIARETKTVLTAQAPPPVATCDKTFADCTKHGNTLQYCGYVNVSTGRHVPCPHTFMDPACIGGAEYQAPPATSDRDPVGYTPQGQPIYNDTPYYTYDPGAGADVESDGFISNVLFPETAAERAQTKTKDCDECYGTGRFKGFGGPCSKGCPTKGEK
jgi:hypothetical protein